MVTRFATAVEDQIVAEIVTPAERVILRPTAVNSNRPMRTNSRRVLAEDERQFHSQSSPADATHDRSGQTVAVTYGRHAGQHLSDPSCAGPDVVLTVRVKVIAQRAGRLVRRTMARGPLKKRLFVTVDCAETAWK